MAAGQAVCNNTTFTVVTKELLADPTTASIQCVADKHTLTQHAQANGKGRKGGKSKGQPTPGRDRAGADQPRHTQLTSPLIFLYLLTVLAPARWPYMHGERA